MFQFQRLPIQQYTLPKIQAQNDVHYTFQAQNDEYTRNLVPPPPSKQYIEKEKTKEKPIVFKQKEQTKAATDSSQNNKRPVVSDTALFQVPPPYHQTTYYIPASNEQAVDVQVTKENIKEFHNNIPYQQQQQQQQPDLIYNSQFANYQFTKKPTEVPMLPTYEVTEEKDWHEIPPSYQQQFFQDVKHLNKIKPSEVKHQNENIGLFLPTPVKPSGAIPTSPTEADISTIFTELSQKINRQKNILDPTFFNIKEVSTHYPILGRPSTAQFSVQYSLPVQDNADDSNEITTIKPRERVKIKEINTSTEIQTTTTSIPIPTRDWQQKRRPGHRRRRPVNRTRLTSEEPSTTTEDYNIQREVEQTTVKQRRRRPVQMQKTTEAPTVIENVTKRIRYRQRVRPTAISTDEEMPHNHKISFTEDVSQPIRGSYNYKASEVRKRPLTQPNSNSNEDIVDEEYSTSVRYKPLEPIRNKGTKPYKYYSDSQIQQNKYQSDATSEETSEEIYESDRITTSEEPTTITTTITSEFITNPINKNIQDDSISIKEIYTDVPESSEEETTLATTTASTTTPITTTVEPKTTTKSNRFRRPIHYKPPRPKFSVKDYHQRLNQYISSTETPKLISETTRMRYRTRRPLPKQEDQPETTETPRKRFIPKSHRQPTASESKDEPVETSIKTINSRIRPFGKYRSTTTTETTTTQKISIKPHIFNTLRRPPPISLKERIQSKYNRSNSTEKNVKSEENVEENETEVATTEILEATHNTEIPTTSKIITTIITTTNEPDPEVIDDEDDDVNDMEIFKNDALLQSQRVSDLTSSTQNQYDTPGMFKSVSPNARKVPNYFALATEDPILPIEAFFPNINKEKFS